MDFIACSALLFCFLWTCFHLLKSNSSYPRSTTKLPPGPYPFPIIGNILQLGQKPHQSLTKLSKLYGPMMHLKLGSIDTIVVSSPEIAKEILQNHDHAFPGRTTRAAFRALDHDQRSVAFLPCGSQWRVLRKICREQMFSTQRLDASRDLREAKLQELLGYAKDCCVNGRVMDIGGAAFVTSLNLISSTLFSIDFAEYDTGSSQELKEIIHGVMRVLGSLNLGDFFPILGLFDPQGIKRDAEFYFGKLFTIFNGIIDQRLAELSRGSPRKNDLLEALLEISKGNDSEISRDHIKHLFLDLFVAGTDTTSSSVEWVMTELLRNPGAMSKAKDELKTVIGENRQVEESDITRLPYLRAVIKETFRYHPAGPFIIRGNDGDAIEINNYMIPKGAQILINIWQIGRDSSVWKNPDSFEPERFLDSHIDIKGCDFELITFGAGRRICPGLPLAYRMVHLMVAYLIHNFDWKLEHGMKPEEIDTNEKFGLTLGREMPLKAIPIIL